METVDLISRLAMVGTLVPPTVVPVFGTTLSSFCTMSSVTSLSLLISGTTSNWRATVLNSTLVCKAALFSVVVAVESELVGTAIS